MSGGPVSGDTTKFYGTLASEAAGVCEETPHTQDELDHCTSIPGCVLDSRRITQKTLNALNEVVLPEVTSGLSTETELFKRELGKLEALCENPRRILERRLVPTVLQADVLGRVAKSIAASRENSVQDGLINDVMSIATDIRNGKARLKQPLPDTALRRIFKKCLENSDGNYCAILLANVPAESKANQIEVVWRLQQWLADPSNVEYPPPKGN